MSLKLLVTHLDLYHSDERLKDNINDISFGLDFIKKFKPSRLSSLNKVI